MPVEIDVEVVVSVNLENDIRKTAKGILNVIRGCKNPVTGICVRQTRSMVAQAVYLWSEQCSERGNLMYLKL